MPPRTDPTSREFLKQTGATILDAPEEYLYSPGYYAVYFTDPDGLKLEFAYAPPTKK